MDKLLEKFPELFRADWGSRDEGGTDNHAPQGGSPHTTKKGQDVGTLAAFLKAKKTGTNQVRKFLATAAWLHDAQDLKRITTGDVSKAMNDHNQGKLTNPAQCLSRNSSRGFVTKDGKQFYVNDDGRAELNK
ncbi:MAG: hypothetical protein ACR2JE_13910 [Acidobacteriaceae bacterium]